MSSSQSFLIGAHISIQGGVHKACLRAAEIGATTMQIFTSNQRQWTSNTIILEEIDRWNRAREATHLQKIMSHSSYLINLGSNQKEILLKSRLAFRKEIERCKSLTGLDYLNFHPGAATGSSEEECLDRIVESLLEMQPLLENVKLRLLMESTAGQGTTIGNKLEQFAYILSHVKHIIPIGICLDTCHLFAAGFNICNMQAWDVFLKTFQKIVGSTKLIYAMHVNDSKYPLGSRKDRHAPLGKGEMGIDTFQAIMRHPILKKLPKYLETPNPTDWKNEIKMLRTFASKNS